MNGKILKISSNDLYGNVDDRKVSVFAVFNHLKYMNKYVIFAFSDEYNKKKLCYGSVHLKNDSLVIFGVNDNTYINGFIDGYINNNISSKEYEIINIENINKVELVSYSEMDYDNLELLDTLSIKKEKVEISNVDNNKKPVFLYILLLILIGLGLGITYLYFNPDAFSVELKKLNCNMNGYDKKVLLNYESNIDVVFDNDNKLKDIDRIDIYTFSDSDSYNLFKDNNRENEYFKIDGSYKYDDDRLQLRLIYNEKLIIDEYSEVLEYLENEGYSCIEGTYDE